MVDTVDTSSVIDLDTIRPPHFDGDDDLTSGKILAQFILAATTPP